MTGNPLFCQRIFLLETGAFMITDFHTHILPGVDDGSRSVEMSVQMLEAMAKQGIRRVVATPHFYAHRDTPNRFLLRRAKAENALRQEMAKHADLPEILMGAEVYYFPGMSNSDMLPAMTISGTNYILIEMHDSPWNESMYRELENIRIRQGLMPIIAHVDRYITPMRQHGIPERLQSMDVCVQANAEFFLDWRTNRLAMQLLEDGYIHLLGSDCHNMKRRAPNLEPAVNKIQKKLGDGPLQALAYWEEQILGK